MWISKLEFEREKSKAYKSGTDDAERILGKYKKENDEKFENDLRRKIRAEIMMEIAQEKANSIIVKNLGCGHTSYLFVLDDINSIIMKYNTAIYEKSKFIFVTDINGLNKSINVVEITEIKENKKQTL